MTTSPTPPGAWAAVDAAFDEVDKLNIAACLATVDQIAGYLADDDTAFCEMLAGEIKTELATLNGKTEEAVQALHVHITATIPTHQRRMVRAMVFGSGDVLPQGHPNLHEALIAECLEGACAVNGQERDELVRSAITLLLKLDAVARARWVVEFRDALGIDIAPLITEAETPTHETPPALDETETYLPVGNILEASKRGEVGDAELLAGLYNGRLKFDHAEGVWYLWSGHHWQPDKKHAVPNLISNQVAAQYVFAAADAKRQSKEDLSKELWARAGALRFRNKRANVLHIASALPALSMSGEEWDANPWLLGVQNGVVDLRTGTMRPGQPGHFIKSISQVMWRGFDCPAPRWEKFVGEIFGDDVELVAFVHRLFGYGLAGVSTEHILPVLWGEGRNGKDTLLETILSVMGPLASPISTEVLLDGNKNPNAATPYVYALRGLRYAWVSETNEGARLDAGQVKLLTGGGTLVARPLHGNPVRFSPQYTLFLVTNHKPHANSDDFALWKRLLLIEFSQTFVENPEGPNERQRDPSLKGKLLGEASGILAWLVRGCLEWQRVGLCPPPRVLTATQEYQQGEDKISEFFRECLIESPNVEAKARDVYARYCAWSESRHEKPMTSTAFGGRMAKRATRKDGRDGRYYVGIGIRNG